jgi:putative nucleotidyltransferase with HDIG domain
MKTLPQTAIRLSKLVADENSSLKEIENVIRMDPTLVLRILRLANSSYYGLQEKVDSVARALVFIGIKNLRNTIVIETLKDVFKNSQEGEIFSRTTLWLHSAAVGICSQMISERLFKAKGEDAFLCGILHDIGLIVEDQVSQDLFLETCRAYEPGEKQITEYERETIGTDHCAVGYGLATEWKLPTEVQDGIKNHHKKVSKISPSNLAGMIQVAEYFAARLDMMPLRGMNGYISPRLNEHIRDNLEAYKELAQDLPAEIEKAKEIYDSEWT